MISVGFDELVSWLEPLSYQKGKQDVFNSVSIDTRALKKGDLFFAIKGDRFDGHDFVAKALKKGASCCIISKDASYGFNKSSAILVVHDTLKAFQRLAEKVRNKWGKTLIAITGSCGKTTTKDIIYQLCKSTFKTVCSQGTQNNHIGVPLSLLQLESDTELAVLELGMNHSGEIKDLTRISSPDAGIITNVGKAHLGFFNSIKEIALAKEELLENLHQGNTAILNTDNRWVRTMKDRFNGNIITFGITRPADIMAKNVHHTEKGNLSFRLYEHNHFIEHLQSPFPGTYNLYNLLAGIASCRYLKMPYNSLLPIVSSLQLPALRWQSHTINDVLFILDTYNANPTSVAEAIKTFSSMQVSGKKFCILGDMLELGKSAGASHRSIGQLTAETSINHIIVTGDYAKKYQEGFLKKSSDNNRIILGSSIIHVTSILNKIVSPGDAVLIKGSRKCALEKILEEYNRL